MSTTGISSLISAYQQNHPTAAAGLSSSIQQLSSALQSGSLSSSQQAFGDVLSSLKSADGTAASSSQTSSILGELQQGIGQIGTDLQSGNVSGAETAFTNLKQQVQGALSQSGAQAGSAAHHHHHGHTMQLDLSADASGGDDALATL